MIELKNITKKYNNSPSDVKALQNINLNIKKGDFIAIVGPSGSGKSTLLNIIGLLDYPTSGEYILDGVKTARLKSNVKARVRNEIMGFVFQSYNLLPRVSVSQNILLPYYYRHGRDSVQKRRKVKLNKIYKNRINKISNFLGIDGILNQPATDLSGGEKQRVAIARALINKPRIVLADEPTGNLDSKNAERIMKVLKNINKKGTTIILVTHNPKLAPFADRIISMIDGHLENNV